MRLTLQLLIFSLAFFSTSNSFGQNSSAKTIIIGSWKFEKLEFVGDLASVDKQEQERINKMNKGNIIIFTSNGKYKTIKRIDNTETQLASGQYEVLENGKYLSLDGEKAEIAFINSNQIKFSLPRRPIMVWTKIKS